jgi:Bacterial Ig-like domain
VEDEAPLFEFHTDQKEYRAVRTDSNQVYIEYPLTSETEYYDLTTDPYQLDGDVQTPPHELQTTVEDLGDWAGVGCRAADRDCSADLVDNDCDGVVDEPGEPCGDPRPPDTAIDTGPNSLTSSTSASFTFASSEVGSTFECSLDGAKFAACNPENNTLTSKAYDNLDDGEHTFSVRARDQGGFADPTPASYAWTVDTSAPAVESVVPAEGATDVSPSSNVHALFSEAMDETSLEAADSTAGAPTTFSLVEKTSTGRSAPIAAEVTYVETATSHMAILDPTEDLHVGATYVARVATAAKDLAGNALDQDPNVSGNQRKTWRFTVS